MFYFWWSEYRDGGLGNLGPGSRRPRTIHRTGESTVHRIVELWEETGWNEKAIAARLRSEGIDVR